MRLEVGGEAIIDPRTMPEELRSVPAVTQWYTKQLEDTIRQAPEQYWWLHRRWKDPRRRKRPEVHTRAA
jgi:Kdo2-lipid IVA lauroyltransferase/acyltransferase